MARPRNHSLRLCSEISVRNLHRQCTTIIKNTVVMSVTDALVCRRLISYRTTTASVDQQKLSQGFWEQEKGTKMPLPRHNSKVKHWTAQTVVGATLHLLWPLYETNIKRHMLPFFFPPISQWPNNMYYYLPHHLWTLHLTWTLIGACL